MIASERRMYIMTNLNVKGVVNLKEVASELNISEATVRRDFENLEKDGKLKRVLGGATLTEELPYAPDNAELTMKQKITSHINMDKKDEVARYASQYVKDGECVFIDGGTTLVPLISYLASKRIKIVTYNHLILKKLTNPVAEVFIVGGVYLPYYSMSVGAIAQDMLKQFHFDHAFIGCSSVDLEEQVAYTTEMESLAMKKIAMENSKHNYLLIDSNKMDMRGFYKFKTVDSFEAIICNNFSTEFIIPDNFVLV
jgi:DeoR/GlpR family transcriptional regulator of sugar metabolism